MALGAGPDIDTDLAIHGSVCISQDRAKTGLNSQVYTGTGPLSLEYALTKRSLKNACLLL